MEGVVGRMEGGAVLPGRCIKVGWKEGQSSTWQV